MMRAPRPYLGAAMAAAALLLALSGCAPAPISAETSGALQQNVVSIAESAASGDIETAVAEADRMQQQLSAGLADGSIGAAEGASIQTALDAVRTDLQALLPAPAPEATPDVTPEPEDTTPVVEDDEDSAPGNGNSGNGNSGNSGNGNGNSGNGKKDKDRSDD